MIEGLLLVNKAKGKTSFNLVSMLRKITGVRKIGHAGTLDPCATGLMIMLIGRNYTRQSNQFLSQDKEYQTTIRLGQTTDTYDLEGKVLTNSDYRPTNDEITTAVNGFQGSMQQTPPMFSAKKIQGQKLYNLARKGITIERKPVNIHLQIRILEYQYPLLSLQVLCSCGTYIRSLAHDIGEKLGCGGYIQTLTRTRSGSFRLNDAVAQDQLFSPDFNINDHLICK